MIPLSWLSSVIADAIPSLNELNVCKTIYSEQTNRSQPDSKTNAHSILMLCAVSHHPSPIYSLTSRQTASQSLCSLYVAKLRINAKTFIFSLSPSTANLATLIYGLSIGWLSPNLELLLSPATPLSSGTITPSEAGWIGSIGTVGCVLAVLICGWVAEIAGRKAALMLIGVTQLVGGLTLWGHS